MRVFITVQLLKKVVWGVSIGVALTTLLISEVQGCVTTQCWSKGETHLQKGVSTQANIAYMHTGFIKVISTI